MSLVRKYWYPLVFLPFLIIAIAVNGNTRPAGALFYSWILVGVWLMFTLYFGQILRKSSEFNSPHNTFSFIFAPIFVGLFYSFWGYVTPQELWGTNLFGGNSVFMSGWDLVFALPYQLVGSVLLWKCFRKYDWVYVGNTAIKARRFGFCSILFFLALELGFLAVFYGAYNAHTLSFPAIHTNIDILLLLSILFLIFLVVYYGLVRRRPTIPTAAQLRSAPARRIPAPVAHSGDHIYTRTSTGRNPNVRVVLPHGSSSRPFRQSSRESKVHYHVAQPQVKQKKAEVKQKGRSVNYDRLKPKAGVLTADDFKCIFCFQLPKVPEDANRGVVLCPNCRYPAHADEFRNWTKNSNLCSRCGHTISSGFRSRPEIISAADYVEVIREFYRRAKK